VFAEQVLGSALLHLDGRRDGRGAMLGALAIGYRSQGTSMQAPRDDDARLQRRAGGVLVHARCSLRARRAVRDRLDLLRADDEPPDADPVDRGRIEARPRDEPGPGLLGGPDPWGGLAMGKSAAELGVTVTLGAAPASAASTRWASGVGARIALAGRVRRRRRLY
jgi:hypothetical protein